MKETENMNLTLKEIKRILEWDYYMRFLLELPPAMYIFIGKAEYNLIKNDKPFYNRHEDGTESFHMLTIVRMEDESYLWFASE